MPQKPFNPSRRNAPLWSGYSFCHCWVPASICRICPSYLHHRLLSILVPPVYENRGEWWGFTRVSRQLQTSQAEQKNTGGGIAPKLNCCSDKFEVIYTYFLNRTDCHPTFSRHTSIIITNLNIPPLAHNIASQLLWFLWLKYETYAKVYTLQYGTTCVLCTCACQKVLPWIPTPSFSKANVCYESIHLE